MFDHGFPSDWSTIKKLIWLKGAGIIGGASAVWKTVTGTLIHITDALASPMQKCEVTLEPIQAGSGDPSPDNVRPITGWTGANVNRTGKNLYMGTKSTDRAVIYGGKNNHNIVVDEDYSFKAGTYRFSCTVKDMVSPPSLFVSQKVGGVWTSPNNKGQVTTFTFTVPENCEHYEIWGYGGNFNGFENIQIELGSASATDYEAPRGTTLSVTFPDGLINQWDEEWEVGSYDDTTGEKISGSRLINKNRISIKPSTSYYLKLWNGSTNDMRILYYDVNGDYLSITGWLYQGVFTTPENAYFMNFFLAGSYGTTYNNDISINYPSTITDYHPYHGDVVYGGTVDLVSGMLTVDRAKIVLDGTQTELSGINWRSNSDSVSFYYNFSGLNIASPSAISIVTEAIADSVKAVSYDVIYSNHICSFAILNTSGIERICVRITDTTLTTKELINAYLAQNPITICYPLATPTEIQLTPQEISTLKGVNNVWSNGDSVEITYKAKAE